MDPTFEKIKEAHEQRNTLGKPKKAIEILEQLGDEIKNDPLLSYDYPQVLKKLAICYADVGEVEKAYESFEKALQKAKEDLNEIETADIRGHIASLKLHTTTPEEALDYALRSWKYIGKKRGERFTETKVDTAYVLGNIYFQQGLYKKAVKKYKHSLKHAESIGYTEGILRAVVEISEYHIIHEESEKAKELLEEYVEKAQDYKIIYANMQLKLSKIYLEKNDVKAAKDFALEAHKVFKRGKFIRLMAQSSQLLGTIYSSKKQATADSYFKTAFDIYNDYQFNIPIEHPKEKDWFTDFEDI